MNSLLKKSDFEVTLVCTITWRGGWHEENCPHGPKGKVHIWRTTRKQALHLEHSLCAFCRKRLEARHA